MIHYTLSCENDHRFDAWFRNAAAYEEQSGRGAVTCPVCASTSVGKALMAPAVTRAQPETVALSTGHPQQRQLRAALQALREKVLREADYVGDRFAEEARRIHFDETEARGIYGEATREEVVGLIEDGVDFMPLPQVPEEHN
ncbi:DUF1178 family protein [Devosia sp.]|uniref:DUF1178 family protein n=1 Tax=Devosia sp. TaxID=1871048 RepID=UPI002F0D0968